MVTKEQAIAGGEFHYGECKKIVGPRGGVTIKNEVWRSSGKCKTWKRSPEAFQLPITFGLYNHSYITDTNASLFHPASECPLNKEDRDNYGPDDIGLIAPTDSYYQADGK
jgi:hypothetical protein